MLLAYVLAFAGAVTYCYGQTDDPFTSPYPPVHVTEKDFFETTPIIEVNDNTAPLLSFQRSIAPIILNGKRFTKVEISTDGRIVFRYDDSIETEIINGPEDDFEQWDVFAFFSRACRMSRVGFATGRGGVMEQKAQRFLRGQQALELLEDCFFAVTTWRMEGESEDVFNVQAVFMYRHHTTALVILVAEAKDNPAVKGLTGFKLNNWIQRWDEKELFHGSNIHPSFPGCHITQVGFPLKPTAVTRSTKPPRPGWTCHDYTRNQTIIDKINRYCETHGMGASCPWLEVTWQIGHKDWYVVCCPAAECMRCPAGLQYSKEKKKCLHRRDMGCQVNPPDRRQCLANDVGQQACETQGCCWNNITVGIDCYFEGPRSRCQINPDKREHCPAETKEDCVNRRCCWLDNGCYHSRETEKGWVVPECDKPKPTTMTMKPKRQCDQADARKFCKENFIGRFRDPRHLYPVSFNPCYYYICQYGGYGMCMPCPKGTFFCPSQHRPHFGHCGSEVPRTCPHGYERAGLKCYKYFNEFKTWHEARALCVLEGGMLAIDNTPVAHAKIVEVSGGNAHTWIGANDIPDENVWKWIDGSAFSPDWWGPNEPNNHDDNEHCLVINWDVSGRWNDYVCGHQARYVCELTP